MKKKLQVLTLALTLIGAAVAQPAERQLLKQNTPEYPALLKKLGIGGTVKLSAEVAPDGTVKKTRIAGGNPMLAEIARMAVSKWKYAPAAQTSNVPVEMVFEPKSASVSVK
jgi:TonB family protein